MRAGILLALSLLFAGAAAGQRPDFGFSTGYIFFGPVVPEGANHVRLGNMGQEQYFQVDADAPLNTRTGVYAALLVVPTQVYAWPNLGDAGWSWRPDDWQTLQVQNVTWGCLTAGLRRRPLPWLEGSAGAGLCSLVGNDPRAADYPGTLPSVTERMTAGTLQLGGRVVKEIADGVGLDASCAVYPAYSSAETEPFGVLREYAGAADDAGGMWISPVKCGAGLRVRL